MTKVEEFNSFPKTFANAHPLMCMWVQNLPPEDLMQVPPACTSFAIPTASQPIHPSTVLPFFPADFTPQTVPTTNENPPQITPLNQQLLSPSSPALSQDDLDASAAAVLGQLSNSRASQAKQHQKTYNTLQSQQQSQLQQTTMQPQLLQQHQTLHHQQNRQSSDFGQMSRHILPDSEKRRNFLTDQAEQIKSFLKPKKKRRRRDEIERKFKCFFPGCTKSYGSEGALKTHQRLKHTDDFFWTSQFAQKQEEQPNPTKQELLPLHNAPLLTAQQPSPPMVFQPQIVVHPPQMASGFQLPRSPELPPLSENTLQSLSHKSSPFDWKAKLLN